MRGINKHTIIGTMGKDPEVRYSSKGDAIVNFSLATNEWNGEKEVAEWHNCVAFGKTAEFIASHAQKGSVLYVEGPCRTKVWEKDGSKHYSKETFANVAQIVSGWAGSDGNAVQQPKAKQSTPRQIPPPPADFSDDIPF